MLLCRRHIVLLATAFVLAPMTSAIADREPTLEERSRIERLLRAEGFTTWEGIKLADNIWEVDDARTVDGSAYDLKLDPTSFQITEREED